MMDLRVGNKYRLGRKVGSGSFGDIYLGMFIYNLVLHICIINNYTHFNIVPYVHRLYIYIGTNISNNEEVAIKLVSLLFDFNLLFLT